MVKQWWSASEWSGWSPDVKRTAFHDDYYGCQTAKSYYDRAMKQTADKKLAALCFYMSQHCAANFRYYAALARGVKEPQHQFQADFPLAQKKGVDLSYYKSIVNECLTYQGFIREFDQ